jgi:hypothetical protein
MWTDRQTYMKPLVAFHNFANAPKNVSDESYRENENIHFVFGKKLLNTKYMFSFSLQLLSVLFFFYVFTL